MVGTHTAEHTLSLTNTFSYSHPLNTSSGTFIVIYAFTLDPPYHAFPDYPIYFTDLPRLLELVPTALSCIFIFTRNPRSPAELAARFLTLLVVFIMTTAYMLFDIL
jgi:peptidoglycan/LPS O-acetylase OafA/YrhL